MELPQDFVRRMRKSLGEEADAFFSCYNKEKTYGLRLNPLKNGGFLSPDSLPFTLSPVPWAEEGFYAEPGEHPGRHPLHEAGAYYIQEPSAMSAVSLLAPKPGEIICDLCAAPGGKSTAIGGRMAGDGLLVSNEIIPGRAKILSQNIERLGITNCIVTNEPPEKMSKAFPKFFDKILVDAPCSGEGMFRKDDVAIADWSLSQVELCRNRQEMILSQADRMLRPGGVLVYSTCTFAPEENEQQIADFLSKHSDYILEDWREYLPADCGLTGGQTSEAGGNEFPKKPAGPPDTFKPENTLRLLPHLVRGEGHFAARLRKLGEEIPAQKTVPDKKKQVSKRQAYKKPADLDKFFNDLLLNNTDSETASRILQSRSTVHFFGEECYLTPDAMRSLDGIRILRAGLHLGTRKKNRMEPSHALAMALLPREAARVYPCSDESVLAYLRGETLPCDSALHSWTLVTYRGFSLGWGKANGGMLKNHYPKGLRKQITGLL